ncbi:KAT8 regulatory NSL complex subunit 1 [Bombina bombina]|uniref:KAT8 regulatory NSL complex subunit 1 n=1 Tax=Bombina bombina TaxID=8345 RepID=UPI00235A92C0|nr:KAT8 regulatory NSL complex subunit 1 [Bombina bombina]
MADMAPALTEAATEAHQRLKLTASSSASSPSATRAKDGEPSEHDTLLPVWKPPLSPPAALPEVNGAGRVGVRPGAARRRPQNSGASLLLLRRSGHAPSEGINGGSRELIGESRCPGQVKEAQLVRDKIARAMEAPVPQEQPSKALEHAEEGGNTGEMLEQSPLPGEHRTDSATLCPMRAARIASRQQELGLRARRLCRRLQVIQAKQVERHVRQQLSGLVELLSERGAAGLPGSPQEELNKFAGSSTARLRAAQSGFDSDATESSSGGESEEEEAADHEAQPSGEEQRPALGVSERSDWRWAVERAAIICRWTWLQAQVSDLEFRIRQQTEIYKQIRCTKGSVLLGDSSQSEDVMVRQSVGSTSTNAKGSRMPLSSSSSAVKSPSEENQCETLPSSPSHLLHNADKQCSRLTQSAENVVCQNPSTAPVSDSPGSQKPSRQVNGLINCVRTSLSCNGSTEDLDPEEVLGKKRRLDGLSTTPAPSDTSCVAARTRPLRGHKKRRLVRSNAVSSLSRKPQKPLSMKCSCEPPTTCILCGCKTFVKTVHPSTMNLNERIALLDPGYHPILSFPHDTTLNLHFEALLKEDRQFRLTYKLKTLKFSQLSKKPLDKMRRECQSVTSDFTGSYTHGRSDQEKLCQYRLDSWQKNVRLVSDSTPERMRPQPRRTPQTSPHPVGSPFKEERQYKGLPNSSVHMSTPVASRQSSALHQLSSLTETPPTPSSSQQSSASAALKRKRLENSYDINNIVIPMSMAAASRVEKLQYKEILTPSWRVVDPKEREPLFGSDPELEDLSDEAYLIRHNAYEDMERSRWDSWSSAIPQRRGSRSSNKSDGRWTPQPSSNSQGSLQPASPEIGFHSLNDVPLSLSSAAPDSPEPYSTVQCLSVRSRTRVLSWSEDTRSSTPEAPEEEEQTVLPWEPRTFPLSDRDHRALQNLPITTPIRSRNKQPSEVMWHPANKSNIRTESIDFGMSTENLAPTSKDSPLPNSISVVRFRAHSGEKIASLEYFPARPVNKR